MRDALNHFLSSDFSYVPRSEKIGQYRVCSDKFKMSRNVIASECGIDLFDTSLDVSNKLSFDYVKINLHHSKSFLPFNDFHFFTFERYGFPEK